MYPPFEYDVINRRRDELWQLADEARLASRTRRTRRERRRSPRSSRAMIGNALIRAGHAVGGERVTASPCEG